VEKIKTTKNRNMLEAPKEQSIVNIKADTYLIKLVKTHGLPFALMLGGLYFLNGKLSNAESRIAALEGRLYDCYEKRSRPTLASDGSGETPNKVGHSRALFTLPENGKRTILAFKSI
jgi:hypothetical protein